MVYDIIGRREQGKTTLMYYMGSKVAQRLTFDPRGIIAKGQRVRDAGELHDLCDAMLDGQCAEVTFTPRGNLQTGFIAYAAEVRRWIEEAPDRPAAFLVDEANKDFIDTDIDSFQWAMRCCSREVHHIMLTAHRPSDITTRVRALTDHWCVFAVRQEHDLAVLKERMSAEVVALVQKLEPRQFVWWNDAKGTFELKTDAASWHVPIRAPRMVELPGDTGIAGLDDLPKSARIDTTRLF